MKQKRYRHISFIIALLLLLAVPFSLSAQDGYEVKKIRFDGNKTFKKNELLKGLAIYEINFIQRITRRKEPYIYNYEFVENDLERLIRFYQSEGFVYVNASVDTINVNKKKRQVDVRFTIQEGIPITVDTVILNIQDKYTVNEDSLKEKIFRKSNLKAGKRYQDFLLKQDVTDINRTLQVLGYAYSQTYYELDIDTVSNSTAITFYTKPGPTTYFGATEIDGNKNVKESYIRHQMMYDAGNVYNADKLEKTRQTLYDLQTFRIASVVPQLDYENIEAPIPIKVLIEEKPKFSAEIGVGYGTEDKFRTFLDLNFRNLFRDASAANFYFKTSALEPYHLSLKLLQPQFLDKKTSIMINPYLRRQIEPGFDTQTLGVSIPLNRKFSEDLNISLTYYYEKVVQNLEEGDSEVPDPENKKFKYDKSGLTGSVTYNNALPRYSPVNGFTAILGAKYNGYFFSGDFDYTKLWLDLRYYTLLGNFQFAVRGMAGGIITKDSIGFVPVEDRFYAGGANSIRGWGRSKLGPKRATGTPSGGKSIVELGVELRHPLFLGMYGAAFVDVGNVWKEDFHYPIKEFAYAAGVGLRYDTPIGPIRFDVSMPLWNEKKTPQFFISVGQAF